MPNLFNDLKHQHVQPCEIIVADAGSDDGTAQLAHSYGVKVTAGGMPAEGRNLGARQASGSRLLFLDADVRIDRDFIGSAVSRMDEASVGAASFGFTISGNPLLKKAHAIAELYFSAASAAGSAHGIGGAILVQRDIHDAIGGFDTTITVGEDHEYLKRASSKAGYRFFRTPRVGLSVRRFDRRGLLTMSLIWLRIELHRLMIGEVRHNKFRYFE